MTARELLAQVADALKARGHDVETGSMPCGRTPILCIFIDERLVARSSGSEVCITAANVFDGFKHDVPPGCDSSTLTPGSRHATVERIVAAIEKRLAARAQSLPVPVDATAIARDP